MIPYIKGRVSLQAHVGVPEHSCEEEYARSGFFGRYAHLYRAEAPVGWTRIEGNLKPRAYDLNQLALEGDGDFLQARRLLFFNDDVRLFWARLKTPMPYFFRNADSDEVLFVHAGKGLLETDFGPLTYGAGDYLVVPRGTVYRLAPQLVTELLVIESASEVGLPDKGMLGQHALFDPAVIKVPEPSPGQAWPGVREYEVKVQRAGEMTSIFYPFHPLNTIGWKGTLTVWQLNIQDIRPISCDRYHLPPSAHTTFVAHNFVICTFLPRPLENGDLKAMKVPFYHSNIDYDEVLFYHAGEFFSRQGIAPGMLTLHPQGIHHGPQNQAIERAREARATNEVAVMVDTRHPLKIASSMSKIEQQNYWQSWQQKEANK